MNSYSGTKKSCPDVSSYSWDCKHYFIPDVSKTHPCTFSYQEEVDERDAEKFKPKCQNKTAGSEAVHILLRINRQVNVNIESWFLL